MVRTPGSPVLGPRTSHPRSRPRSTPRPDVKDGHLTIPAPELDRPREPDRHAPTRLKMKAIRRTPGDPMQTKPRGPELSLQPGISRNVIGQRRCPALRITGGDDCKIRRPVSRERFTPKHGLLEEVTLLRIHGRKTRQGGRSRPVERRKPWAYFCAMSCSSWIAQGWFLVVSVKVTFTNLVSLAPK